MNDQIKREEDVHGKHWNDLHGGYFSDPDVAKPFIETIQQLTGGSKTDTIIDLGGGTGAFFSLLIDSGIAPEISLGIVDDSTTQLDTAKDAGFSCIRRSIDSFTRDELGQPDERFMFIMRSVLHYLGKDGLRPTLGHLLEQTQAGEFFVHQTASFRHPQDAECLNELYRMMRTNKWYPTVDHLCECLRDEGWQVLDVLPGTPLALTSEDLMHRYNLNQADIASINKQLPNSDLVTEEVFKKTRDGFCAYLHYWIYVCTPINP